MAWPKFQKTERGWQELQQRTLKLDPGTRAVLILCNGRSSLGELRAQFGAKTDPTLQNLIDLGLVEMIVPVSQAPAAAAPPPDTMPDIAIDIDADGADVPLPPSLPLEGDSQAVPLAATPPVAAPSAVAPAPKPSLPERAASLLAAVTAPAGYKSGNEGASSQFPPSSLPSMLSNLPELRAAKQRALVALQKLFGPGGGTHGAALLQAEDLMEFEQALRKLHDNVAVYQGRKGADALIRQIREG